VGGGALISTPRDVSGDIDGSTTLAGVAPGGRRVSIAFNENPATQAAFDDEPALVQTGLCDHRGTEAT
jgi:D-alanyl-D-alanine carboxypeptidase